MPARVRLGRPASKATPGWPLVPRTRVRPFGIAAGRPRHDVSGAGVRRKSVPPLPRDALGIFRGEVPHGREKNAVIMAVFVYHAAIADELLPKKGAGLR